MAHIKMDVNKLNHNFQYLNNLFLEKKIEWGVVSKVLCGNTNYLKELINLGIREIHDSRISNLKAIKRIDPNVQTVYIKPPARHSVRNLLQYADVSFNTEFTTIQAISEEAVRQEKEHKIIIMIELGDLREGVMGDDLVDFYGEVFKLPKITVVGLGTNLNCLHGVLPSNDKLIQMSLYKQLIEARFQKKIKWVSGGTSVTIPLLHQKLVPSGINHFRIGETLFFGNNLITGKPLSGMKTDVFLLSAEIIELIKKPKVPSGEFGENVAGQTTQVNVSDYGKTSYRAILDIGLLDINPEYIRPVKKNIDFSGASSDMIVVDIGQNRSHLKVGDYIEFRMKYMGALSLLNSRYIEKRVC